MSEEKRKKKFCKCRLCKISRRIKAEWDGMTVGTQKLVEELYEAMANAEEDATYWRMRHHGDWVCCEGNKQILDGTLKTLCESSAEMNLKSKTKEV